jgi:hypothetical protein
MDLIPEPRSHDFTKNKSYYTAAIIILHDLTILNLLNLIESRITGKPLHLCLIQSTLLSFVQLHDYYNATDLVTSDYSIDLLLDIDKQRLHFSDYNLSPIIIMTDHFLVYQQDRYRLHFRLLSHSNANSIFTMNLWTFSIIIRTLFATHGYIPQGNQLSICNRSDLLDHFYILQQFLGITNTLAVNPTLLVKYDTIPPSTWYSYSNHIATSHIVSSLLPALSLKPQAHINQLPLLAESTTYTYGTPIVHLFRFDQQEYLSPPSMYTSCLLSVTYLISSYNFTVHSRTNVNITLPTEITTRILQYHIVNQFLKCHCSFASHFIRSKEQRPYISIYALTTDISRSAQVKINYFSTTCDSPPPTQVNQPHLTPEKMKPTLILSSSHLYPQSSRTQLKNDSLNSCLSNHKPTFHNRHLLASGMLRPLYMCTNHLPLDQAAPTISTLLTPRGRQ